MTKPVIGTWADGGQARIDLDKLLVSRLLVQAASGGGKSYLLRKIFEATAGLVQQIIIDPDGEFSSLREKHDYIIAAVNGGDALAHPRTAGILLRRIMETGVSAIIDISELKKPERRRFVRLFIEELMGLPRSMWTPLLVAIDEAHEFCLSADTEILTKDGFRPYTEIVPGVTEAVCFDPATSAYSYGVVSRLIVLDHDGEMIHLHSDGLDSLSTLDHRVVLKRIQRGVGRYKLYDWTFCAAAEVPTCVVLPIGGAPIGEGLPGLSLRDARIMGWIITDGYWCDARIGIEQSISTVKRGRIVANDMRQVLSEIDGISTYNRAARVTYSMGRERHHAPTLSWYFAGQTSDPYLIWLRSELHRVPREILTHGSREQLEALYLGLMEGDGTAPIGPWRTFYPGKNSGLADDLQELALRLGISATKTFVASSGQWVVRIAEERSVHWSKKADSVNYCGKVWDITVPTSAFVARRNGKVFVTGNCPEKDESESLGAVIDLATRGRKRGFALLAATQRIGKFSKDCAAELLNKLVGLTALDVDVKRAAFELGMGAREAQAALSTLDPGHFYAYGPAISKTVRDVVIGNVETTHPRPGTKRTGKPPKPTAAILAVLPKLADLPREAEAEARSLDDVKKELANVRRELTRAKQPAAPVSKVDPKALREVVAERKQLRALIGDLMKFIVKINAKGFAKESGIDPADVRKALDGAIEVAMRGVQRHIEDRAASIQKLQSEAGRVIAAAQKLLADDPVEIKVDVQRQEAVPAHTTIRPISVKRDIPAGNGSSDLPEGEAAILRVCIQFGSADRSQLTVLTGYKRSTRDAYISRLQTRGLVSAPLGRPVTPTEEGRQAMPHVDPAPTGEALQEFWRGKLPEGERKILDILIREHPNAVLRDDITESTGFKRSTRDAYLSRMAAKKLLDESAPAGTARATEILFT